MPDCGNLVKAFHPSLQQLIKELISYTGSPISNARFRLVEVRGDRFSIKVPLAAEIVQWDIVFNLGRPRLAPDFNFNDDTFVDELNLDELKTHVPDLVRWNPDEPKCLLLVIQQFIKLYKRHQIQLLQKPEFSRLLFEYSSLVEETKVVDEDLEILVGGQRRNRSICEGINFLIRLNVNFANLPPVRDEDDGDRRANLLVNFQLADWSRIHPKLYLSPRVEKALGPSQNYQIPQFPSDSCLMDYVPLVINIIENEIQKLAENFERKKKFISLLFYYLAKSIIEYDFLTWSWASFLLEKDNFHFLLTITFTTDFPSESPQLTFQSVYQCSYNKPYQYNTKDYQKGSNDKETIQNILSFINLYSHKFRIESEINK